MAVMVDPQQREMGTAGSSFDCEAGDSSGQWLSGKSRAARSGERAIWILITVALGAAAGTISFFALEGLVKAPAPSNGDLISFDLGCIQNHLRAHHPRHEDSSDMVVDCEVRGPGYGRAIRKFLVQSPRHLPKRPDSVRSTPPVKMGPFDFLKGEDSAENRPPSSEDKGGPFDFMKEAFKAPANLEAIPEDRITPWDRWTGATVADTQQGKVDLSAPQFVDPNDASNYISVALSKPMGISFFENDDFGGVYIDKLLPDGSAINSATKLTLGDQLVGVDSSSVMGRNIDDVLDKVQAAPGPTTKLTFFRGPKMFLYGPTAPSSEWYSQLFGEEAQMSA